MKLFKSFNKGGDVIIPMDEAGRMSYVDETNPEITVDYRDEVFKKKKYMLHKRKTTEELIEEIHETFFTEVDRLLEEAGIIKSEEPENPELHKKADRLRKLGFKAAKAVSETDSDRTKISEISAENAAKKDLKKAINYFSTKYPQYKFITEKSVKRICQKYGLIYGDVSKYIGDVPEKNIKEIEDFKINENDYCYEIMILRYSTWGSKRRKGYYNKQNLPETSYSLSIRYTEEARKCALEIAAPKSDFNTRGMEIEDFELKEKVEIPDPVVLQPVYWNGKKHYLIVSAWGLEASDELVVNEKMN